MAFTLRLNKELARITQVDWLSEAQFVNNDPYQWGVTMQGPPDSPYQGGKFKLKLSFPARFVFS